MASTEISKLKNDIFSLLNYYRGKEFDIPLNDDLYNDLAVPSRFDNADTMFVKHILQCRLSGSLRDTIIDSLFNKYINIPEHVFAKELYMNFTQIKCMKKSGMYFGIHGYNHDRFEFMDSQTMQRDIDKSLSVLDGVIDNNNWIMSYPYGSYNTETINFIKKRGCAFGFTTVIKPAKFPIDKPWEIPRFDTNDFPPISDVYKQYE